jgi:hypothetical protein
MDGGNTPDMQQTQEKPQQKIVTTTAQAAKTPKTTGYRPSPLPTVLATSAKIAYGLSAASLVASVGIWNRVSTPKFGKAAKKASKNQKPSERQYREAQQLGAFIGLLSPTFAVVGKVLDDASERAAASNFARWEKQQAEKARNSSFARFFTR